MVVVYILNGVLGSRDGRYCFNRIDAGLEAAVSMPKKSSVAEDVGRGTTEAAAAATTAAELDASSDCQSLMFLLSSRLLWCPLRCRTSSCSVSKHIEQKQQLYRPPLSGVFITFRCTEQRCFRRCAFCLNMATHRRHANGFSPVCTRRWVFRFQDMPNCLPQYSQRYSRRLGMLPPLELLRSLFPALPALLTRLFSRPAVPFSLLMKLALGVRAFMMVPPPGSGRPCGGHG